MKKELISLKVFKLRANKCFPEVKDLKKRYQMMAEKLLKEGKVLSPVVQMILKP